MNDRTSRRHRNRNNFERLLADKWKLCDENNILYIYTDIVYSVIPIRRSEIGANLQHDCRQ